MCDDFGMYLIIDVGIIVAKEIFEPWKHNK
jgi:hypothetical protein